MPIFAGQALQNLGRKIKTTTKQGMEGLNNAVSNIPSGVVYGVPAGALGAAGGYLAGKVTSIPSEQEKYSEAAQYVAMAFPGATPEDIDYEANRLLYDTDGEMTPLQEGGSWEEFKQKRAAMANTMPLDATGAEVGYM